MRRPRSFGAILRVDVREVDQQGRSDIVACSSPIGLRHRGPRRAYARRARGRTAGLQPQDQVHAARLGVDRHMLAQHAFQARDGHIATLGVELAHALDMASEVAFGDERSDDRLDEFGTAARTRR